jgi:hypothetical protein
MSKIGEHKVRFLSLFSLQKSRGSLLLAESALFTVSLLRIRGHSGSPLLFFLLSERFAISLTFVFRSFPAASHIKREFSGFRRAFQRVARRSPATSSIPPKNQTHAVGTQAVVLFIDVDSAAVSKQALRPQENIAEEHAALALVTANKKRSVSCKDVVKPRA